MTNADTEPAGRRASRSAKAPTPIPLPAREPRDTAPAPKPAETPAPAERGGANATRHNGSRRRDLRHWLLASVGFGLPTGPLIALAFDHGRPEPAVVAIVAAPILVLLGLFVTAGVLVMRWRIRAALWRTPLVLLLGSVVFLLPDSLNPPATGDFWWATVLEKYALSCLPYPFAGWLVMPGIRRRPAIEVCAVLAAALALTWPVLLRGMRDQTADTLRRELGLPPSMLYVLDTPGATTVHGYTYAAPALSLGYRLSNTSTQPRNRYPDLGYDVDIAVFPATAASPCAQLPRILFTVDGFNRSGMSCAQSSAGIWHAADDGAFESLDDATEVGRFGDYYVAVTIGRQSTAFDGEFAVLFADLRHPSSAQLVGVGLSGGPSPLE